MFVHLYLFIGLMTLFGFSITLVLYVNCSAGISRSGAVGYILNWYANRILEDHPQDFELFPRLNPQIDANPLVKKILTEVIMKQNPTFPEVIP